MTNVAYTVFGTSFPALANSYGIVTKTKIDTLPYKSPGDKLITPHKFGYLLSAFTAFPCALAVPFFLFAGYKMVSIKKMKVDTGEFDEAKEEKTRLFH